MEELVLLDQLRKALTPHYDVERLLGHGGMGMVALARDRALDRPVAIKVISPDITVTPRHRQRFLQEARIVAKLRHPNIVAVYAAGEADGLLYFVMEYVPGAPKRSSATSRTRSPSPTRAGSCTATSSPRTCCSTMTRGARCSRISGSLRPSPLTARSG